MQAHRIEFTADLNEDPGVFVPTKRRAERRKANLLSSAGNCVHLDARPFRVVPRKIAHVAEIEIAASATVDIVKHIEDELRRESLRIGVSRLQDLDGFYPVCSKKKIIMRSHGRRQQTKEAHEVGRIEISDGAAEKDKQGRQIFIDAGKAVLVARV